MNDQYKRNNRLTGKPFEPGYEDEDGRIFVRYLDKHGNDGYYYEEWAKDKNAYLKKINRV
ncbi:MAG: hypothetical protein ACPG78_01665 [Gammaproteobacteria bacterium]|nr:hypothetical protein [Pseudomonadota bacterium]NCX10835.1 hypothetical protein [Pseudomonadota bacterium]NCX24824.1 hypothetical protein [Pseudomonadota bacterium]